MLFVVFCKYSLLGCVNNFPYRKFFFRNLQFSAGFRNSSCSASQINGAQLFVEGPESPLAKFEQFEHSGHMNYIRESVSCYLVSMGNEATDQES